MGIKGRVYHKKKATVSSCRLRLPVDNAGIASTGSKANAMRRTQTANRGGISAIPRRLAATRAGRLNICAFRFDPTDIITHRLPLDEAQYAYEIFDEKKDGCIKVVLKP